MSQPGEVSKFTGQESAEEAERWLETFVNSTGSFSDSGIFRLLGRKLPAGSVARQWFDLLEENVKTSWGVFEREFCSRWIFTAGRLQKQAAWEAFTRHLLSDNAIFSGKEFDDVYTSGIISEWVEEHLRLGKETGAEDSDLLGTTKHLLPSFIQAYFQVYIHTDFQHFGQLCASIISIPSQIFRLEFTRRQLSPEDRILGVERRIEVISEKMDKLMNFVGRGGIGVDASGEVDSLKEASGYERSETRNISSKESIAWEHCSPVTTVASILDPSSATLSELSTPIAQSGLLPGHDEDQYNPLLSDEINAPATAVRDPNVSDNSEFLVPSQWRKTTSSKSRAELVEIARQAIEPAAHYGSISSIQSYQLYLFMSAVANYDTLTCSQLHQNSYWYTSGTNHIYDYLLEGLFNIHFYYIDGWYSQILSSIGRWSVFTGLGDYCGIYLELNRTGFEWRNTWFEVNLTTADTSNILGGIFAFDTLNRTGIVSVKTVLYMTLSSYLAECTGELKYTETALQCAHFIKTWMIDPTTSLIKDCTIDVKAVQELSGAVLSCHLTGAVIEGFSVLASVTSDDEWRTLAIDISKAAMKYNEWHSGDGILTVGTGGNPSENTDIKAMKGLLNHGLMVAYQRNRSNEPFCNLIRSYINVQFNALYDWARFQNKYGVDWRGPFIGPYPHGQIAAVDTLVAAIGVND